jgi:hypothetical protein
VATTLHQAKPAAPGKYDAAVEAYLARARRRIRSLDVGAAVLVLLSGTLAFALVMVLCDRWLVLSPLTRQLALLSFGIAALLYLVFGLVIPLTRQINPYFAARHLEQVVPGAKNSIVNWLDLRAEPLPAAIRAAVGQRAAKDLASADMEQAISGQRAAWLGGFTGALAVAAFVLMALLGARPFTSLLGRTFDPFAEGAIATRTRLTLLQPEGGNVTVPIGRSVRFAVEVHGRVPDPSKSDAVRLQFHYQPGDPYEERLLERDHDSDWTTTLPVFQVQNGFWYKIAAGDTETEEYRVQVRATPLINGFEATYHYRPYLGWKDDSTHDPNLRALRGTEVTLVARTNRTVRIKESRLDLELPRPGDTVAKKTIAAEPVAGDPQALAFRLVLEESGTYRVWFTSAEGEINTDPMTYSVTVLPDHAPQVELTKPGQDVTLPANGVLPLEGVATDDIGLKSLALHLRLADGPELQPKPYRQGKSFRLADGGYPKTLQYKDFVELDKVRDADGKPQALQPKMVLEYWLEAADDCDSPGPNVGRSKTYKVTLGDPDADRNRQQQERQKAQQEQQKHEAKQDQQLKQENQNPRPDTNPDHAQSNQQEQTKPEGNNQQNKGQDQGKPEGNNQQNKGQDQGKPEGSNQQNKGQDQGKPDGQPQGQEKEGDRSNQQPNAGEKQQEQPKNGNKGGEPKGGSSQQSQQAQPDQREQQAQRLADAIKKEQQEQQSGNKGGSAQQPKGEKKDQDSAQSQPKPDAGQQAGNEGQAGTKQPEAGKEGSNKNPAGQEKPESQPGSQGASKEPKEGASSPKEGGNQQAGNKSPKNENRQGAEERANGSEGPKGEPKEQAGSKSPAESNPQDVQNLARKLESGTPGERKAAEKKLEQAAEQAKDSAAREQAKKALEKHAQEKKESSPGLAKPQPKPSDPKDPNQTCPCQCKNGNGSNSNKTGGGKGAGAGQGNDAKGTSKGDSGRQTTQAGAPQEGAGSRDGDRKEDNRLGSAKGRPGEGEKGEPGEGRTGGTGGGGTPGEQLIGGRQNRDVNRNERSTAEEPPGPDGPADPRHRKRPGELVLEDLRKTLEDLKKHPEEMKKVLKRAGLQEKDVRNVEQYLEEKLPPPQQEGALSNIGARQATSGQPNTSNARVNAPAQPPPGFRSSTREFNRKLAEPDDKE